MPRPYVSCFTVCPSAITCTSSSLTTFASLKADSNLLRCGAPERIRDTQMHRLEAGNVFCLKAFGAFLHFKFNRLTFVERFVSVHRNRGEVYENVFPGLALDKTIALRSIEPLDCSLFLHFHYLVDASTIWLGLRHWNCFASLGPYPG